MTPPHRNRPVTLNISEDVLQAASDMHVDASRAAEEGIREALRKAKGDRWLQENKEAIEDYNKKIRKRGLAIPPSWAV